MNGDDGGYVTEQPLTAVWNLTKGYDEAGAPSQSRSTEKALQPPPTRRSYSDLNYRARVIP